MRRGGFPLCLLALALALSFVVGCAGKTAGPSGLVGYWRGPASLAHEPFGPHLILIRRVEGHYLLRAPMLGWDVALTVQGNRLVLRHTGSAEYVVFSQRPGHELALADYYRGAAPKPVPTLIFTPANGSSAALAAELHGWHANATMPLQSDTLVNALGKWWQLHHRYPARSALLPGGSFWRWSGAPHLTNAVTGGAMRLGPGPGNFGYSTGGVSRYSVTVHFYGGGDTGQSGF
jgi:hypothetical protein